MSTRDRFTSGRMERADPRGAFSAAVDLIRRGETVLTLIDPAARGRDPAVFSQWLSARLTIGELPRVMLPGCDDRCATTSHDPDAAVVLGDLALDSTQRRPASWWAGWNETLDRTQQVEPIWFAGAPAMPVTPDERRLRAGSRLRRLAVTDPTWVTYDGTPQEVLYRIEDGPLRGGTLVAVTFGPTSLLPALAGALIAADHPPVRDPAVGLRMLAAGWSAVQRGLPYEE